MNIFETINMMNIILAVIFFLCCAYQIIYIPVTLLRREPVHASEKLHPYAILIAARNEEMVISCLLDSIKLQDYPGKLITIFVVADNCTDYTADIARDCGAIVYERFDTSQVGKGYAIDYLMQCIKQDYGYECFDGFFVFDADNLIKKDYVSQMNRTFCDGYEIITGYRNTKNYGDNWISAGYALMFLRDSEFMNHSRMLLGTSCSISGTGFLVSRKIIEQNGGWPFHLLTEDIEFAIDNVVKGECIGYCHDAIFYDEQPVSFIQSWWQRIRWVRGYLQVFNKYGLKLITAILKKHDFACFDMCMAMIPAFAFTLLGILVNIAGITISLWSGERLSMIFLYVALICLGTYLFLFFIGAITTVTQWHRIETNMVKKVFYMFTFPIFMLTFAPISVAALFGKVEWKPVKHNVAASIQEFEDKNLK